MHSQLVTLIANTATAKEMIKLAVSRARQPAADSGRVGDGIDTAGA